MSPTEEALAADLSETGSSSWSRLYGDFSSNILVEYQGEYLPMSAARNLAYDSNQAIREGAYRAELAAWKANEITLSAAMNAIKGETQLLNSRRGWESVLDEVLFDNNLDRASLEAMMSAATHSFPTFRKYLRAKAKALGHSGGLPWYDIFAPVGIEAPYEYSAGEAFVESHFYSFSQAMGDLAVRSRSDRWVDAGPRLGKRDGAFCMGVGRGTSRILMNYKPVFNSVSTLAHELGHAYHNHCLRDRSAMQLDTPMPLAETASIFCETIIKRAAVPAATGDAKIAILEAAIQGSCQVVVDITSRYLFETKAFAGRAQRSLSADELCGLMAEAQAETYGDGLADGLNHPYMWAAKPHYYSGRSFYNWPYMFGLLFALGLYAIYEQDPDGFRGQYDDLLSSTGMYPAKELASRFGIRLDQEDFWRGSLQVIADDIAEFESLVG